ncbi:uncharacterized protein LOC129786819 [Lutzomyia longipalpis]|uniref:uncharacterized protein LOC129786819 n=1 Tax=Lutzomyia longipalpis TaxID=7200 RepID=UPI00248459DD|nr:uncharacterized protein LOC129786819 [Lutzomyia longipalpis]XP_055678034.1 uncharacterized protein LOC129786819 [Lutzomyia longipalpis]
MIREREGIASQVTRVENYLDGITDDERSIPGFKGTMTSQRNIVVAMRERYSIVQEKIIADQPTYAHQILEKNNFSAFLKRCDDLIKKIDSIIGEIPRKDDANLNLSDTSGLLMFMTTFMRESERRHSEQLQMIANCLSNASTNASFTNHPAIQELPQINFPANATNCKCCDQAAHSLHKCPKFLNQNVEEKFQTVKRLRLCRNCFAGHMTYSCTFHPCTKCQGWHNVLLHEKFQPSDPSSTDPPATTSTAPLATGNAQLTVSSASPAPPAETCSPPTVLTVSQSHQDFSKDEIPRVTIPTASDDVVSCRIILDGAATVNSMTHKLYERLNLPKYPTKITISGVNDGCSRAKFSVDATIGSRSADATFNIRCFILPKESVFAYVVGGEQEPKVPPDADNHHQAFKTMALDEVLSPFFKLENIPEYPATTENQIATEYYLRTTYQRSEDGRFILQFPFKKDPRGLGDSRPLAIRQHCALERRFEKNPALRSLYIDVMQHQPRNSWIEPVPDDEYKSPAYYRSRLGLLKDSSSMKLRIVCMTIAKTSTGVSHNDILRIGRTIQPFPAILLLRFRKRSDNPQVILPAESLEIAQPFRTQLIDVLSQFGFPLAQWSSSYPELCPPIDDPHSSSEFHFREHTPSTFGHTGNPTTNSFLFALPISLSEDFSTKYERTSTISRILDPIGLIGPLISQQKVHAAQREWDNPVSQNLQLKWKEFVQELQNILHFSGPLWISSIANLVRVELHAFAEACQKAYCAAIFVISDRLQKICATSQSTQWKHVSTHQNPADTISRGATPLQLQDSPFWWNGPSWLVESQTFWPPKVVKETRIPEKAAFLTTTENKPNPTILSCLLERYSSLTKMQFIISHCSRFIITSKNRTQKIYGPHSTEELKMALEKLILWDQSEVFPRLQAHRRKNQTLDHSKWNEKGIVRVGVRLKNSNEPSTVKHPILLPKSRLTEMIIQEEYLRMLHSAPTSLLSPLRQRFWPLSGRNTCKKMYHICYHCNRAKLRTLEQLMADLPHHRTSFNYAFEHTCVGFAVPIQFRPSAPRGASTRRLAHFKGYIAVFVYTSTRAVYIESVSPFRCFTTRKATPRHMHLDCGKNFEGATREWKERLQQEQFQRGIQNSTAQDSVIWHYDPPGVLYHGGLWEAGVKRIKFHLYRIIQPVTPGPDGHDRVFDIRIPRGTYTRPTTKSARIDMKSSCSENPEESSEQPGEDVQDSTVGNRVARENLNEYCHARAEIVLRW